MKDSDVFRYLDVILDNSLSAFKINILTTERSRHLHCTSRKISEPGYDTICVPVASNAFAVHV